MVTFLLPTKISEEKAKVGFAKRNNNIVMALRFLGEGLLRL
jgi:hypothetical protein